MSRILSLIARMIRDAVKLYVAVVKVMVPAMIVVKIAEELGAIEILGRGFAPLMSIVGLPAEMGLVISAVALVGIFSGMGAFFTLLAVTPLTVAQATILGSMALIAHNLPVEQQICRRAGVSFTFSALLRLCGAFAYGAILNAGFSAFGLYGETAVAVLPPVSADGGLVGWATDNAIGLAWMFAIILGIVVLMRTMEAVGLTRLLQWMLAPPLRLMGMSQAAAPLTVIGILLGILYGSSLIMRETEQGHLSRRDVFLTISFLCLAHAVIDDTLFVMTLGGQWPFLLVGRFLFAMAFVALLSRGLSLLPEGVFDRWLMVGKAKTA